MSSTTLVVAVTSVPNSVSVECSLTEVSGRDLTTSERYQIESVYPKTLHQGSFLRALVSPRILELHDIKDGNVVLVRWYQVSADGQVITASSRPSTGPMIYRKQN